MEKGTVHCGAKKRKKRRWTKEERRARKQNEGENPIGRAKPEKDSLTTFRERVLHYAEKCSREKGVMVLENPINHCARNETGASLFIRTVSSGLLQTLEDADCKDSFLPYLPASIVVVTKPLLICDINGILCHRVRRDPYPHLAFRESIKKVSGTPVIPRPGLGEFLEFLSLHFCLAIWTSAKPKSAQLLVKAIIPESVRSKLIFLWAQNQCQAKSQGDEEDVINNEQAAVFVKSLRRVYNRYPLWNPNNTILMDDSKEKIASQDAENVLQPIPMNGKQSSAELSQLGITDDQDNHRQQMKFLASLVTKLDSRDRHEQLSGDQFSISTLLSKNSGGSINLKL